MRPILLEMTAFGSYGEKAAIDFGRLSSGLFLVTGDTGAGKTTIFDAIVFALYGVTSGSEREANKMHSDYAELSQDTVVALVFEQSGKEYTVTRTIHFGSSRTKPGEYSKPKLDASLIEPDGKAWKGAGKVTERVGEIIGFNEGQFRQIVMLAQGEFKRFLQSNSDEKSRILGKLFDHTVYARYQDLIMQARDALKAERAGSTEKIAVTISQVFQKPDGDAAGLFIPDNPELIAELSALIAREEEKKRALDAENAARQTELSERNRAFGNAEEKNKAVDELASQRQRLAHLEEEAGKQNLQAEGDRREEHREKIQALTSALEKYDELEKLEKAVRERRERLEKNKADRDKIGLALKKMTEWVAEGEGQKKACLEAAGKLPELMHEREEKNSVLDALAGKDGICREIESIGRSEQSLQKEKEELMLLTEQALAAKAKYDKAYRQFIAGQAGLLAEQLEKQIGENGEAWCPVCGSHLLRGQEAHFAHSEEDVPTQATVDHAKESFEKSDAARRELDSSIEKQRSGLEVRREEIRKRAEKLFKETVSWEDLSGPALLPGRISLLQKEKEELDKQIESAEQSARRAKELERQLENDKKAHDELATKLNLLSGMIQSGEEELLRQEKEAAERKKKLPFDGKEETEKELKNRQSILESIEKYEKEAITLKELIRSLAEQTAGYEKQDLQQLREEIEMARAAAEAAAAAAHAKEALIGNHRQVLETIREEKEDLAASDEAWRMLSELADIAGGSAGEGGKLSFERYVMGATFREIIEKANLRLEVLSGGQYQLVHQIGAARSNSVAGLAVGVLDRNTGMQRESSSLSGGESFLVSLALALGLSDEVRSRAGGQSLDTMFIDEGFGSLDGDSLDKAIQVLDSLSNDKKHLVGIISHVSRLEESIPQKILVKNGKRGSTVRLEGIK